MSTESIEIKGKKFSVQRATAVEERVYKVGDPVRILVKKYGDEYESYTGAIIRFDDFESNPTIVVAYLNLGSYPKACEIKYSYVNSQNKDVEMTPAVDDELTLSKGDVLELLQAEIHKAEEQLRQAVAQKAFFLKHFQHYFIPTSTQTKEI